MIGISILKLPEQHHQEAISILTEKHFEMSKDNEGFLKGEVFLSGDKSKIISITFWISREARQAAFKAQNIKRALARLLSLASDIAMDNYSLIKTTVKAD